MVQIPKKNLGNLLSKSATTFGGFAVVVEKRPSFSVKCLLRRQSTRDYEQHNAIPLIITGAFESSCEELFEVYFRFAQLSQERLVRRNTKLPRHRNFPGTSFVPPGIAPATSGATSASASRWGKRVRHKFKSQGQ